MFPALFRGSSLFQESRKRAIKIRDNYRGITAKVSHRLPASGRESDCISDAMLHSSVESIRGRPSGRRTIFGRVWISFDTAWDAKEKKYIGRDRAWPNGGLHHQIIVHRGTRHNGYSINRWTHGLLLLIKSINRPTTLRDNATHSAQLTRAITYSLFYYCCNWSISRCECYRLVF